MACGDSPLDRFNSTQETSLGKLFAIGLDVKSASRTEIKSRRDGWLCTQLALLAFISLPEGGVNIKLVSTAGVLLRSWKGISLSADWTTNVGVHGI